jgi:choline kinase
MLCVIPAAGRGVRFNELGKNYPKCVLPYQEIPIIVHNIRFALEAGARIVTIVIGHQGHRIVEVVKMYYPNDDRIRFEQYVDIGIEVNK